MKIHTCTLKVIIAVNQKVYNSLINRFRNGVMFVANSEVTVLTVQHNNNTSHNAEKAFM